MKYTPIRTPAEHRGAWLAAVCGIIIIGSLGMVLWTVLETMDWQETSGIPPRPTELVKPTTVGTAKPVLGTATWLAKGLRTPDGMVACSRDHAIGSFLEVEHDSKVVVVKVVSWGPEEWTGHSLDLSRGAFRKLCRLRKGVIDVRFRVVE